MSSQRLTSTDEFSLAKMGYTLNQIDSMNAYFLQLCDMNNTDDSYGMRLMSRTEIIELVVRDYQPQNIFNVTSPTSVPSKP
jgi:hypothetical protein